MRVGLLFLALCLGYVATAPRSPRIVGGSETTISQYPAIAVLLRSHDLSTFYQECGGSILNTRSILTAANCQYGDAANRWRVRVGSTHANSGGTVHSVESILIHTNFDSWTMDNDIAILRTATPISYINNAVQAAFIAGPNYSAADGSSVWAAGWGVTAVGGPTSEQLRHVQVWTVNQATCRSRYTAVGWPVTDIMLCSGYLDVGGRDQCLGDNGGPLYHNGVVIGIYSWGYQCALAYYPAVNTRISSFSTWIQENA